MFCEYGSPLLFNPPSCSFSILFVLALTKISSLPFLLSISD